MRTVIGFVSAGLLLLGVAGCSASAAQSSAPTPTPTVSVSVSTSAAISIAPRQDIQVFVDPTRIVGGSSKNLHLRARCPQPQNGSEFRATAHSSGFTGLVTLVPPIATPSPSPASTVPEVRGTAILRADAKAGGYVVEVRCEATNDVGKARFTVLTPRATPTTVVTPTSSSHPTGAIHAGGGGTAAGGPEDDSGLPTSVTVILLLAALGIGVGVARRRSS